LGRIIGDESDARISGVERRLSKTTPLLSVAGATVLNAPAELMRQLNANRVFIAIVWRDRERTCLDDVVCIDKTRCTYVPLADESEKSERGSSHAWPTERPTYSPTPLSL
jgi:hypothetical protein